MGIIHGDFITALFMLVSVLIMKVKLETKFDVIEDRHYGMCFGVKAASETAQKLSAKHSVTLLGELTNNASVKRDLESRGVCHGKLEAKYAVTEHVLIYCTRGWRGQGDKVFA